LRKAVLDLVDATSPDLLTSPVGKPV
jgi:hypothetical protein